MLIGAADAERRWRLESPRPPASHSPTRTMPRSSPRGVAPATSRRRPIELSSLLQLAQLALQLGERAGHVTGLLGRVRRGAAGRAGSVGEGVGHRCRGSGLPSILLGRERRSHEPWAACCGLGPSVARRWSRPRRMKSLCGIGRAGSAVQDQSLCGISRADQPRRICTASSATSVGVRPTRTPRSSSACALAAAVPELPDTIAPAWPICLPAGAVKPAM